MAIQGGTLTNKMRIYSWNGSAWMQKGSDINFFPSGNDNSVAAGISLNTDGTVVAVACPNWDSDFQYTWSSFVRVYNWNGSSWTIKGSDIPFNNNINSSDYPSTIRVGNFVSLNGDGTAVTFTPASYARNRTFVYAWNERWFKRGLEIDIGIKWDDTESSVAISRDGTTLVAGARYFGRGFEAGSNGESGTLRVYRWSGAGWYQLGSEITGEAIPSTAAGSQFGRCVAISSDGNVVASGAPQDGAGYVKIYAWNGFSWTQRGNKINGKEGGDEFGKRVSLNGNGTVVAATGKRLGQIRIHSWDGSNWVPRGSEISGGFNYLDRDAVCLSEDGSKVLVCLDDGVGAYRWA